MLDEQELVKRICSGEIELFREIITQYQQKIASLCYKMSGNYSEAEDMSQQIFLEVFKSLNRFRFQCQLSTFIYKIAFNTIVKWQKKEKRLRIQLNKELEDILQDDNEVEESQYLEIRIQKLREALIKLNDKQRTALCLHVFENLPYKEIALSMKISVPAVESLIFRAKKSLHKIMEAVN